MNVAQLKELLEGQDDDAEVRIALQPSWPLRANVANVVAGRDAMDDDDPTDEDDALGIVWIVAREGVGYGEHPYAPRAVFDC